jgi:hypothetical protein
MPELVQISVGHHPREHGQLPYSRMSFTFTQAFPGYHFEWVSQLVSDASGKVVPLAGTDVLKVVFDQAQAHSADGTRSTIVSQPGRPIGYPSMTDYARAGDYEGVLTYGIGSTRAVLHSNPQTSVRVYEVEVVTAVRRPVIEAGRIRIQNACFAEAAHGCRPRRLSRRMSGSS